MEATKRLRFGSVPHSMRSGSMCVRQLPQVVDHTDVSAVSTWRSEAWGREPRCDRAAAGSQLRAWSHRERVTESLERRFDVAQIDHGASSAHTHLRDVSARMEEGGDSGQAEGATRSAFGAGAVNGKSLALTRRLLAGAQSTELRQGARSPWNSVGR